MHVARLQRGRSLSIGGTNGILNDARASGVMGDALHRAHLGASAAGDRALVPVASSPAGEASRADGRGHSEVVAVLQISAETAGFCMFFYQDNVDKIEKAILNTDERLLITKSRLKQA